MSEQDKGDISNSLIEEKENEIVLQRYEMMYFISTLFSEEEIKKIMEKLVTDVAVFGGKVVKHEDLGRRKLAYKIGQHRYGHYGVLEFELEKSKLKKFEDKVRLTTDEVVRYLILSITPKTEEQLAREKAAAEKIRDQQIKDIQGISDVKGKTAEVELPEDKKKAEEKESKKVSLEDLDKKLDEILDDNVNL